MPRRATLALSCVLATLCSSPTGLGVAHASASGERPRSAPAARPAAEAVVTRDRTVRLATGQTVRLRRLADGAWHPQLPGATPYVSFGSRADLYVVPRTPASRLPALDLSLFDTSALSRATTHGRTPVRLRLAPGVHPARVAGLRLDTASRHRVGRSVVVRASYGRHFAGFDARSLRGIASVRLAAPAPRPSVPADVATHTVQVHVARGNGTPASYAVVTLQDTTNGDYLEQAEVDATGVATFSDVPEGEYSVVTFTFRKVLLDRQFEVTGDRTIEMDLADATVKPAVSGLAGHRLTAAVNVARDPQHGVAVPFGFSGPRFWMRLQPTSGRVRHGDLHTGVTTTYADRRGDGYDHVAVTLDVARGVPTDLTYVHHRRDFSRLTDVFYANGPAAQRPLTLFPGNRRIFLLTGDTDLDAPVPGRLHLWVQAGRGNYLQQTVFPLSTDADESDNTQVGDLRAYRHPGSHAPITFLHGPVGPGLEAPPRSRAWSGARRYGNVILFSVPLLGGAGPTAFDFADPRDASWSLRRGARVVAHGHQSLYHDVNVPPGMHTYRLTATSHPHTSWDLSTRVRDTWVFRSRSGQRAVRLLTPTYLPPTTLSGDLGPGRTGFRLSFHSSAHSPRVVAASVELSTDNGRSWHAVHLVRTSGLTFHVAYRNPAAHGERRYVSLRVTARDARGDRVQETAMHAYRLR